MLKSNPTKLPARDHPGSLVFIVPQLPPAVCGLADYSTLLLSTLKLDPPPRILVASGAAATHALHPELKVLQLERRSTALLRLLEDVPATRVVLEYVGYGYQSRCCPLWLLRGLRKWRLRNPGARLVLRFHELWFEPAWWKPDFLLQRLHRQSLRKLAMVADKVLVSTEGFAAMIRDCIPPERLRILPVGSNIVPVVKPGSVRRVPGRWILFGRQGSRIMALERLTPWLAKFYAAGKVRVLQIVGPRESDEFNRIEDRLLRSVLPDGVFQTLGSVPALKLSSLFLEAEMAVCGHTPGAYAKSGIFMAYASHGVNILAPAMPDLKEPPLCWVTHPAELETSGADFGSVLADRSARLKSWFNENASWERIAAVYREELRVG